MGTSFAKLNSMSQFFFLLAALPEWNIVSRHGSTLFTQNRHLFKGKEKSRNSVWYLSWSTEPTDHQDKLINDRKTEKDLKVIV